MLVKDSDLKLAATLLPSFPHFSKYASDTRLSCIRFNSAGARTDDDFDSELSLMKNRGSVPIFFDVKGRQLRVTEVYSYPDRLELDINHPIEVETPNVVLFKAGADGALLKEVKNKTHLIFEGGPDWMVSPYESIHIRHPSLKVLGPTFLPHELERIEKAKRVEFDGYYLSYVQCQKDVDELQEIIGKDAKIMLKIEDKKGLRYVEREFKKKDNLVLVAARGDLYVELDKPHEIINALCMIIDKDSKAQVGSRIMLSIVQEPVPSCADFLELAWLYDIGYRDMLLCDEICLKENFFTVALGAFESFRNECC